MKHEEFVNTQKLASASWKVKCCIVCRPALLILCSPVFLLLRQYCCFAAMCDMMLELNLSSFVLHVSLLGGLYAPMQYLHPHQDLQHFVRFGQPSVEDLELRSEKYAGETQTVIEI